MHTHILLMKKAIQKGARHPRIYLKPARAALNAKRFDLAAHNLYLLKQGTRNEA